MVAKTLPLIDIDRLQIGIYVVLDLGWKNHPFLRSRFVIRSEAQLAQLRGLGIDQVRWSPELSECEPLPGEAAAAAAPGLPSPAPLATPAAPTKLMEPVSLDEWDSLSEHWIEDEYEGVAARHAALLAALADHPETARGAAEDLAETVATALSECDRPTVRLLTDKAGQEQGGHEIAVAALSLLLGREIGLEDAALRQLSMAALLHDMGKLRLPPALREDSGTLAASQLAAWRRHVEHGVDMGREMQLDADVLRSISEHHEHVDGSGFPGGLRGDQLSASGKVLAIANRYMNLVCPQHSGDGLTPHQALQQMYGRERERFDATLLAHFVRMLGVYPPGSLVELSDRRMALVVASRPGAALTPRVRIIESQDADILSPAQDMDADSAVKIQRSLPPDQLNPRWARRSRELARAAFFFEPAPAPEWRSWGEGERESESSF